MGYEERLENEGYKLPEQVKQSKRLFEGGVQNW